MPIEFLPIELFGFGSMVDFLPDFLRLEHELGSELGVINFVESLQILFFFCGPDHCLTVPLGEESFENLSDPVLALNGLSVSTLEFQCIL